MSSDAPVIHVADLSKCFRIYNRPRDRLKQLLALGSHSHHYREFWALKDINFDVYRGQTVGIIGQNGSGKSTLLQIITGTMSPTQGIAKTRGKIAALLELGSGFNPDFTGRENVYLNGSLLGLTRNQIEEKFDYIVGFADIGEHLEQPVKTYSSGMMLRLAFAVQVAVETEVLIIDEALAVGDARFQLKCFKRLEELKARGTTILFVSHATEMVRSFCDFGLVLEKGRAIYWGNAKTATLKYLASIFPDQTQPSATEAGTAVNAGSPTSDADGCVTIRPDQSGIHTFGAGGAQLDWMEIYGLTEPNIVLGGAPLRIRCKFSWDSKFVAQLLANDGYKPNITLGFTVADKKGLYIFGCNGFDATLPIDCLKQSQCVVEFSLTTPHFAEGDYFLAVAIALGDLKHHIQLKWYDSLLSLRYMENNKKVFGLLAVDYKMKKIEPEGDHE
jgi:lipopolysaccharide transport system ATP-binding protein